MDEPLFDASSDPNIESSDQHRSAQPARETPPGDASAVRPFLGIRFDCCKTYGRIYRNAERTAYVGTCPSCFATLTVPIGDGGTSSRFFTAR